MTIRKLNVLFVVPRYETYGMPGHYVMPMGILCVSAYVKRADVAKVFTLNLNHVEGGEYEALAACIRSNGIDVMGVGGLSGEYRDVARMTEFARSIKPDITVVVGGGIVTADPLVTMQALPEADYGIVGEGEVTMTELLEALTCGETDMSAVAGLVFRQGGKLMSTAQRPEIKDLDALPFPDYEGSPTYIVTLQECIDTINGEKYPPAKLQKYVEEMQQADAKAIQKAFNSVDLGVNTRIKTTCKHCGHKFEYDLPITREFF